jgi:hypothetical protein
MWFPVLTLLPWTASRTKGKYLLVLWNQNIRGIIVTIHQTQMAVHASLCHKNIIWVSRCGLIFSSNFRDTWSQNNLILVHLFRSHLLQPLLTRNWKQTTCTISITKNLVSWRNNAMSLHKKSSAIQILTEWDYELTSSLDLGTELAKQREDLEWTDRSGETKPCL